MSNEAKIAAICSERAGLRQEIVGYEHSMHQAMFAFLTTAAAFAGLFWNKDLVKDPHTRNVLLVILTQFEFFLALFVVGIEHCAIIAASYIGALETKINHLAGETISAWQTKVVRYYVRRATSPFSLAFGIMTLVLLIFFGVSLHLVLEGNQPQVLPGVQNEIFEWVGGGEALLILFLMTASIKQRSAAASLASYDLDKIDLQVGWLRKGKRVKMPLVENPKSSKPR